MIKLLQKYISFIVLFLAMTFVLSQEILNYSSFIKRTPIEEGWEYFDKDEWMKVSRPCIENINKSHITLFRLKPKNPDILENLFFKTYDKPFEVSIGKTKIYSHSKITVGSPPFLGFPNHSFSVPHLTNDDYLVFKVNVPDSGLVGFCDTVYSESSKDLIRNVLFDNIERTIAALISITTGIAALIFAFSVGRFKALLSFVGFALSLGFWIFSCISGPSFKFYLIKNPVFWAYLDLGGIFFSPPFIISFYLQIFLIKSRSVIHRRICSYLYSMEILYFLHAIVVLLLSYFEVIYLNSTLEYFNFTVLLFLPLIGLDLIILLTSKATRSTDTVLFSIGFFTLIIFGIHDVFVGNKIIIWSTHLAYIGVVGVIISSVGVIVENFKALLQVSIKYEGAKQVTSTTIHDVRKVFRKFKELIGMLVETKNMDDYSILLRDSYPGIVSDTHKVESLLNNILDINSETTLKFEPISVTQLINESLEYCFSSGRHRFKISYNLKNSRLILCDKNKINRVLINIIDNAIQSFESQPNQVLWFETSDIENNRIKICIGNTGKPIPKESMNQIMTPYFTSKKDGHGLGLQIVNRFVTAHGGNLEFESSKERGTIFSFDLPSSDVIDFKETHLPTDSISIHSTLNLTLKTKLPNYYEKETTPL